MEQLLQYYETELDYIRRAFDEFEAAHPQKAKALGITAGRSTDPDIQRLADSVALHAARLSLRLDETLPETALDLLRMLAPTFLLGAPSYVAVALDAGGDDFADPVTLPSGTRMPVVLDGDTPDCLFSVARTSELRPIQCECGQDRTRAPAIPDLLTGFAAARPRSALPFRCLRRGRVWVSLAWTTWSFMSAPREAGSAGLWMC